MFTIKHFNLRQEELIIPKLRTDFVPKSKIHSFVQPVNLNYLAFNEIPTHFVLEIIHNILFVYLCNLIFVFICQLIFFKYKVKLQIFLILLNITLPRLFLRLLRIDPAESLLDRTPFFSPKQKNKIPSILNKIENSLYHKHNNKIPSILNIIIKFPLS